jgi:hypothetical protein
MSHRERIDLAKARREARGVPEARPWVFMDGVEWRQRGGAAVPLRECVSPHDRVRAADFAALMEQMMGGEEGAEAAP